MKILLFLLALSTFLAGGGILAIAESAIHEIEAFLLFLIATVLFSACCIIDALEKNTKKNEKDDLSSDLQTLKILTKIAKNTEK